MSLDVSDEGVRVTEVHEGSAAAKAGVRAGDVIVGLDGHSIETYQQLLELLREKKVGDKIKLRVRRGDDELKLKARLGARAEQREVLELHEEREDLREERAPRERRPRREREPRRNRAMMVPPAPPAPAPAVSPVPAPQPEGQELYQF